MVQLVLKSTPGKGFCMTKLGKNGMRFRKDQALLSILHRGLGVTGTYESGGSAPEIVSWASGTDEQIAAMIDYAHQNPNWSLQTDGGWSVGDKRTITVGSYTGAQGGNVAQHNVEIALSSFSEYMSCGNVLQFDFANYPANDTDDSPMNSSGNYTTSGGYGSSGMKTITLPNLVNALPTWLKERLIEFSVLCSAGNKSSNIVTVTGNKLALRSEIEVLGTATKSFVGEGSQIPYYETAANRKKRRSGGGQSWLLRSPDKNTTTKYCMIDSDGGVTVVESSDDAYFSPFGCL